MEGLCETTTERMALLQAGAARIYCLHVVSDWHDEHDEAPS